MTELRPLFIPIVSRLAAAAVVGLLPYAERWVGHPLDPATVADVQHLSVGLAVYGVVHLFADRRLTRERDARK